MSTKRLRGALTALVTPMNNNGSVDFGALDALVDAQLAAGIDGLVPCGTTGESATMNADERQEVITAVVKKVGGKIPVIAGAGANDTAVAIEHQKRAKDTGADYALVATPYYNKPTPDGLVKHYAALWDAAKIPIISYNVPGRTACDMLPDTLARLAKLEGVVGVKEATADLLRITPIRRDCGADFALLSGDDFTSCPFTFLGGDGVISVTSNFAPKPMVEMIRCALEGKVERARELHHSLIPLFEAMFYEPNPIPVKAAMAMKGMIQENYRLPLCEMTSANRDRLKRALDEGGWA